MTEEAFRGNPNLKRLGQRIEWTPELIEEWIRCKEDPIYFGEKYFTIVTENGRQLIEMYDYQKELIMSCVDHRHTVAEMARQSGKSTTVTIFALWFILFQEDKTIAILANKADTAREILGRIQLAYEALPRWMQHGVKEWNKGSFVLENGSRILAAATSATSIRGFSIHALLIDEAAHIDNWEEFFTSVYPTISAGKKTKIILISTVYGLNHFYTITTNARKNINDYNLVSVDWSRVPGRDEKWKEETLAGMNYDYEKFAQEFENEYLGSSGTLISGWKLKELSVINQEPILRKNGIYQYERPERGKQYYLIADTSRGKGLDYSAFSIIDVNQLPYRQVCIFRDNLVTPIDYAEIIHRMARIYNDAYCLIENNDIGQQVADLIYHDYEYENILSTESAGRQGKRISTGFGASKAERGIRTTKTVKSVGCSMLKLLIEQNQLEIVDKNTIQELQTFSKKHDSYEAENGATDDLVMSLVLFGWLTNQDFFKSSTDINTMNALRERSDEEIMADVMPFGIVDNHQFPDVIDPTDHYMPYQPYDQSYKSYHIYDRNDENEGF